MPNLLGSRSDDGRVMVADLDSGFIAGFEDGVWSVGKVFSADDLKDNFRRLSDSETAAELKAARKALSS